MHYNLTFDFFPSQFFATATHKNDASNRMGTRASKVAHSQPVTYHFLVEQTIALMKTQRARLETVAPTFASRTSLHGKLTLKAYEWTLQSQETPLGQLRMVHICGAKNEIINTWIFPNRPSERPVFAAELIAVGNATKVAFVDIQTPVVEESVAEEVAALTAGLSPRFSGLPCNETPPDWAIHDSPGHYTYARDVPYEQLSLVEECYQSYLQTYLKAFAFRTTASQVSNSLCNDAAIEALHVYQQHHMTHSPGNKFLSKLFGSDWTESFMNDFLFAKPRG